MARAGGIFPTRRDFFTIGGAAATAAILASCVATSSSPGHPKLHRGLPLVIAHRGNSSIAPENTLAAFASAARSGADLIEIDIHPNAEGIATVIHDDAVDRTTDGTGLVAELNSAEIAKLDAGSWFAPEFAGQTVPTLSDVITLAQQFPQARWLIEFKGAWNFDGVARVRDQLTSADPISADRTGVDLTSRVMLQSFDVETMEILAQEMPEFRRGLLVRKVDKSTIALAESLDVMAINPSLRNILPYPQRIRELRAAGFEVMVWTVNDPSYWALLIQADASAIITDRPDQLIEFLARFR